MIFNVEMLAFGKPNEIRKVDVPNSEITDDLMTNLQLIFHYGQNDFQDRPHPSVSVGDVIEYNNKKYTVDFVGFSEIGEDQLEDLRGIAKRRPS
jgi:hypothetical protein